MADNDRQDNSAKATSGADGEPSAADAADDQARAPVGDAAEGADTPGGHAPEADASVAADAQDAADESRTPDDAPLAGEGEAESSRAADDGQARGAPGEPSLEQLIAQQRERLGATVAKKDTSPPGGAPTGEGGGEGVERRETTEAPVPTTRGALQSRFVQAILVVNTLLILGVVAVMIWQFGFLSDGSAATPAGAAPSDPASTTRPAAPAEPPPRPMSWARAEAALEQQQYKVALAGYRHLHAEAARTPADSLVADLLVFRRGYCLAQMGRGDAARALLREATASGSPLVRAAAWYHLGALDLAGGQHLQARTKAYRALGALGAVAEPLALAGDCDALAARAVTSKVLWTYGQVEAVRWTDRPWRDPFAGLSQAALRDRLRSGTDKLEQGLLGPQVARAEPRALRRPWHVRAVEAHLDELLARLGAQARLDVRWVNVRPPLRERAVTVFAGDASETRIAEIAVGAAGLVARFTGETVDVYDPNGFDTLTGARDLLTRETNACWRRLLLRLGGRDTTRAATGRFALAVVQELAGDTLGAIKEYQLVAGRFDTSRVAPRALLRCARLRLAMNNDDGARSDLQRLLDKYPDFQAQDEVYLALGEANRRAGQFNEAISDLRRLYVQNLSADSRAAAAYGLGRCYHAKGMPVDAETWLTRFIGLAEADHADLPAAYLLRGRCRDGVGNIEPAEGDLRRALVLAGAQQVHLDAALALSELYLDSQRYVRALGVLSDLDVASLPQAKLGRYLVLSGRMYRHMGLPNRGVRLLTDHLGAVKDTQARARVAAEIARGYLASDQRDAAEQVLTDVLEEMTPCAAYYAAACDLAQLCLHRSEPQRAIRLTGIVRTGDSDEATRRRATRLLGEAYALQGDYRNAALAYSNMLDDETGGPQR